MCLISSLKDAAIFLRDNERLFLQKIKEVIIMGGVQLPLVEDEPMLPDTAHNNQFDSDAADMLYSRLQQLQVPMLIVTRHAAAAAKVPEDSLFSYTPSQSSVLDGDQTLTWCVA